MIRRLPLAPDVEPERREFLKLAGAALALASLPGCDRAPRGTLVPYASQPPEDTPGVPLHYATALTRDGYAVGVIVESHEGRPTKIEGNPGHPMSLGGTGVGEQASLRDLYDRDRAARVSERGRDSSFDRIASALASPGASGNGRGLHLLLEPSTSLLTGEQLDRVRERFPGCTVHFDAPLSPRNTWAGARLAFGEVVETLVDFDAADVVLTLDANVLVSGPSALRSARQVARRRRPDHPGDGMSRIYVVEPAPTVTGNAADHRLRLRRSQIESLARALLSELAVRAPQRAPAGAAWLRFPLDRAPCDPRWVRAVATDLLAHAGRSAVVVGETQPAFVHALGHAINTLLGNVGRTLTYCSSPVLEAGGDSHGLSRLAQALRNDAVETLFVVGGNPAYASPGDLELPALLRRAKASLYLGSHENETALAVQHVVPLAHPLECWGDARAVDGTASLVQPLRRPLENRPLARRASLVARDLVSGIRDGPRSSARLVAATHWRRGRAGLP